MLEHLKLDFAGQVFALRGFYREPPLAAILLGGLCCVLPGKVCGDSQVIGNPRPKEWPGVMLLAGRAR